MQAAMTLVRMALSLLVPGLLTSAAFAQTGKPVESITGATLEQYRGEYGQSPLCSNDEITLWSCQAKGRVFSLCSSPGASRTTGYLQYRASTAGKLVFAYPVKRMPPLGMFKYNSSANGDASVEFSNDGYGYTLVDPLRERSFIEVVATGPSRKTTTITCGPNQTLQVNYTMRLMHDFGIWASD